MTPTGIAAAVGAALVALVVTARALRRAGAGAAPAAVQDTQSSTSHNQDTGAVRSVQTAELVLPASALAQLWSPENLERLARTYWRFLSRVTLGLIHVSYSQHERSIVLLGGPLKLLTFLAPEYEVEPLRGLVRWRVARGLLVARHGHYGDGYLQIEVRRQPGEQDGHCRLQVQVEVANFYPSIASRLSRHVYDATQSRIHVIVTHAFLRSLARLDLAESKVGRLSL